MRNLLALILVFAGCAEGAGEWQMTEGFASPERAVEAFYNDPQKEILNQDEFASGFFPRLPERFRQGGRMKPRDAWTIESSYRALVLSRLEAMREDRPVKVLDLVERERRETSGGMEILYAGPVELQLRSGRRMQVPYVRTVVRSGGRWKVATVGTGD